MSYVQLKDTAGSGRVILGPTKLFSPAFCRPDHSAPFEHPRFAWSEKWRAKGQSYRFYSDVSELLQLVSYVQLKDTAGSGETSRYTLYYHYQYDFQNETSFSTT